MIFLGAENIISPLGVTAEDNFLSAKKGLSGIQMESHSDFPKARISNTKIIPGKSRLASLGIQSIQNSLSQIHTSIPDQRWLLVVCTTKGEIDHLSTNDIQSAKIENLAQSIASELDIDPEILIVSNACISGVSGAITAHDLLKANLYDHAIVLGIDAISDFTSSGFESFFALSKEICKPYDKNRTGLNLGEAASTIILSKNKTLYTSNPMIFAGGATANDANHISGPSRTGEGLFIAINKALKYSGLSPSDIDYVSAHGTATAYNDDMESIAFDRVNLSAVPTNSLKGFFGHTLGAAGVVEIAMTIQSMRNDLILQNFGLELPGTSKVLNVPIQNESKKISISLKTASGFGGCNAAAIIKQYS